MSFNKINVAKQIKEKCKNDTEFNELWRENKEYELLRCAMMTEDESENIVERIRAFKEDLLIDEEHMKWACKLTTDMFGAQHLNGTITAYVILSCFERINQSVANDLLDKLLFEYQDEYETYPLILTGERVLGKYLFHVLRNPNIHLNGKQQQRIAECVIQDATTKVEGRTLDGSSMIVFLLRTDIPANLKKEVIDALPDEFLYVLKQYLEEEKLEFMLYSVAHSDIAEDVENKEFFSEQSEESNGLDKVIELIDDKLYS